jgi:hypothetical protein
MSKNNMRVLSDSFGGFIEWEDAIGKWPSSFGSSEEMVPPAFRLIRYDDSWRPLGAPGDKPLVALFEQGESEASFEGIYGGDSGRAYGVPPGNRWPNFWPPSLDAFAFPSDIWPHVPMRFCGTVRTSPVASGGAVGTRFTVKVTDLREAGSPGTQNTIRMPVGIEIPMPAHARIFGTEEAYEGAGVVVGGLEDSSIPKSWYYLEPLLFGLRQERPEAESFKQPARNGSDLRVGAPIAAFSTDGHLWTSVASEPDYGAAALWSPGRLRFFSTLYLPPGESAEWSFVVWRSEAEDPSLLLLQCTRGGGFFDALNPRGFVPQGAPDGPIVFGNISRLAFQLDQVRALQPGLVLLNYHYDHISSTANLYGQWKTYEGFDYSEEMLRKLISDLRKAGAKSVGCYGTQIEQPESHRVLREDDIVLDPWGRRFHAWEPGNWIVDAGNRDCGERLARAEAELCKHYGLEAVFVDRIDHSGINANPARIGKPGDARLERIPSIRLGILELNKQRMKIMRELNPNLRVGMNNTTGWAGVRYSDWNQLEGGNTAASREICWLMQPDGVVDKRHTTPLFAAADMSNDYFQAIGEKAKPEGFLEVMRRFIGESLFGGVEASPYGDEWFVDEKSMFYNGSNAKSQPDEAKLAKIASVKWDGGAEWREMWEAIRPALAASRALATPPVRATNRPDSGEIPPGCKLHARLGDNGGVYIAVLNTSDAATVLELRFANVLCHGEIPPNAVRVWWAEGPGEAPESLVHALLHAR